MQSVLASIDTGSAVDIVRHGILEKLRFGKKKLHANTKKFYGVTEKTLDTTGKLKSVPIGLDPNRRIKTETDLLAVTNLSDDLILGQQFLSQHKFCVDFMLYRHQICDFEMRVNEMLAIVVLYYN